LNLSARVSCQRDHFHALNHVAIVLRVGPTTPKPIDAKLLRSIRPTRATSPAPGPTIGPSAAAGIAPARSELHPGGLTPPLPSDPDRPNPSRDRVTDGRTAAFTADGPGDPTAGRGEADRLSGTGRGLFVMSRFFPAHHESKPGAGRWFGLTSEWRRAVRRGSAACDGVGRPSRRPRGRC
jgi:hypothetical protein